MSSDGDHCTQEYTLLPELLRRQNYRSHSLGKWDVGFAEARCHPTRHARGGYDSWLGYYEACLEDYFTPTFVSRHDVADTWSSHSSTISVRTGSRDHHRVPAIRCQHEHGAQGPCPCPCPCSCWHRVEQDLEQDLSNCTGTSCVGVAQALTGTYNARAFTAEAMRLIRAHAAAADDASLFIYLAYHNVHLACGASYGTGLQAPCATVMAAPNERIAADRFKLQAAMLTELDFGVGNTTEELKRTGLWDDSLLVFTSDNGGPLNHGTNAPLRGGK